MSAKKFDELTLSIYNVLEDKYNTCVGSYLASGAKVPFDDLVSKQ